MTSAALLPDPSSLHLLSLEAESQRITAVVTTTAPNAFCPLCQSSSSRVHSRYQRIAADLPWSGWAMRLRLTVRRFFCENPECERKIFTERLPEVIAPYAHRTLRLTDMLIIIGFALGGEAGFRLARGIKLITSPDTLLRLIRTAPEREHPTPRILGVDDWSWKRGHTYGTILLDLERRVPIEILPDREATTLATWLKEHPGVQIVSRDRGGTYAEGVRLGAPGIIQVADRFHLLRNLGDAVQTLLTHHLLAFRKQHLPKGSKDPSPQEEPEPLVKQPGKVPPRLASLQKAREEERLARYEQVLALREQGLSHQAIADRLGMGHSTVQQWLAAGRFPQRKAREQSSKLDGFLPSIQLRRSQGCHNMVQLHQELRVRGYQGSYEAMRHILERVFPKEKKWQRTPPLKEEKPLVPFSLSAREATWLFLRQPDKLSAKEQKSLEHLFQIHEEVGLAYQLAQQFAQMLRTRTGGKLDAWLASVAASPRKRVSPLCKEHLERY